MATLKSAFFWSSATQTSPRRTGTALCLSPFFAHSMRCRDGETALEIAIDRNRTDIAAYLCIIGASQ
jgi:hypothetical protein